MLLMGILVAALGGTTWGMVRAGRLAEAEAQQRRQAEAAAVEVAAANAVAQERLVQIEQVVEIFGTIFADLNPERAEREGKPLAAALGDRLDRAAAGVDQAIADDPLARARLLNTLAASQLGLGQPEQAARLFDRVRGIYAEHLGGSHTETLKAAGDLAAAYQAAGRLTEAEGLLDELLRVWTEAHGPDHPEALRALNHLALTCKHRGQVERAIALFEDGVGRTESAFGSDDPRALMCRANLAAAYVSARQPARPCRSWSRYSPAGGRCSGPTTPTP